jgi:hypothetical protein
MTPAALNAGDRIVRLVESWMENDQDQAAIMGGTIERVFEPWGGGVLVDKKSGL